MRLVLIGGGGHAGDVLGAVDDIVRSGSGDIVVAGILADDAETSDRFSDRGAPRLGSPHQLTPSIASHYVLAVGWPAVREQLHRRVDGRGVLPATLSHPEASVHRTASVGSGTVILGGARIAPAAQIGHHVLVGAGAIIGHDAIIHDFASVMPAAVVGGGAEVGHASLVGSNATVLELTRVGAAARVGAGAVVLHDVPAGATVVGVPARQTHSSS